MKTVITIVVIALIVVGAYFGFIKKEMSETADWQTYTNAEYGFEFKYPEGWGECYSREKGKGFYPTNIGCVEEIDTGEDIDLGPDLVEVAIVSDSYKGISNVDQLKTHLFELAKRNNENLEAPVFIDMSETEIDSVKTIVSRVCDAGCLYTHYVFLNNGDLLSIVYGAGGEDSEEIKEKVLSTFKFTK